MARLVQGGHIGGNKITDVAANNNGESLELFESPRIVDDRRTQRNGVHARVRPMLPTFAQGSERFPECSTNAATEYLLIGCDPGGQTFAKGHVVPVNMDGSMDKDESCTILKRQDVPKGCGQGGLPLKFGRAGATSAIGMMRFQEWLRR